MDPKHNWGAEGSPVHGIPPRKEKTGAFWTGKVKEHGSSSRGVTI